MYPPVGVGQVRVSSHDVTLSNRLLLPAGTIVWVNCVYFVS